MLNESSRIGLTVWRGRIRFQTVLLALAELDISVLEGPEDRLTVLIWEDSHTKKTFGHFDKLLPWNIVNRIPKINSICRKVRFIQTLRTFGHRFPHSVNFLPRTFVFTEPNDRKAYLEFKTHHKTIIKPDNGSLGEGITILEKGSGAPEVRQDCIAQEYIESSELDGHKFDLRVYALIIATRPHLTAYVYRDGIVRVCSDRVSANTVFSQLTNTHINSQNPGAIPTTITQMIHTVFGRLRDQGINPEQLWRGIDEIVAKTVVAVNDTIQDRVQRYESHREKMGYARYFQLLGFDIMFDKTWKPWVLEVNYRPSLEFGTTEERDLKVKLLREVISVAVPLGKVEAHLRTRHSPTTGASVNGWLHKDQEKILNAIESQRSANVKQSGFVEVVSPKSWGQFIHRLMGQPDTPRTGRGCQQGVTGRKPRPSIWRPIAKTRRGVKSKRGSERSSEQSDANELTGV